MSVIIKVDTGFVGGTHEEDTGLSVEEWGELSRGEKNQWLEQAVWDRICVHAEDEDNPEEPLD
jgi:hypothetical protein